MVNSWDYEKYLQSERWRNKRQALVVDNPKVVCYCCGERPTNIEDLHLHHLTYERLGNEDPRDIVPVCRPCHSLIHYLVQEYKWSIVYSTNFVRKKVIQDQVKLEITTIPCISKPEIVPKPSIPYIISKIERRTWLKLFSRQEKLLLEIQRRAGFWLGPTTTYGFRRGPILDQTLPKKLFISLTKAKRIRRLKHQRGMIGEKYYIEVKNILLEKE